MKSLWTILAAGACVTVGALFGPTFATATVDKVKEVIVENDAGSPVPVEVGNVPAVAQAGTPVQFRAQVSIPPGASVGPSESYAVPTGKRLRIDHVTFHDDDRDAKVERLRLLTRLGDVTIDHAILIHRQGTKGDAASQPILAYADHPDSAVRFHVSLDQPISQTATHNMYATFMGVLLDA